MSKFDDKVALYSKQLTKLGVKVDEALLRKVTKGLGPSIYKADAELLSTTDEKEVDRMKTNFMKGKLGLSETQANNGVKHVKDVMGSTRKKYRAACYYLIVKKYKKASVYG